mmetsp:Transcript_5430/g.8327  ORF Transcript_5430/g.8327 Transcript_5430/m.8327 type:complete len:92 (+) Transcript_5430:202-477(+)
MIDIFLERKVFCFFCFHDRRGTPERTDAVRTERAISINVRTTLNSTAVIPTATDLDTLARVRIHPTKDSKWGPNPMDNAMHNGLSITLVAT